MVDLSEIAGANGFVPDGLIIASMRRGVNGIEGLGRHFLISDLGTGSGAGTGDGKGSEVGPDASAEGPN